ncbi:MAG TPA: homoserine kinase, partial [Dermatophilaceae bacterium]
MTDLVSLVKGSSVRVRVPASSANIGPGFDSIGLALGIWDECVATVTAEPGLVIEVEGEGAADVPRDERHLVHRSMVRAWEQLEVKPPAGLHLSCRNAIPHGRGLGSSASAIVAGIVAAQGLCDMATGRDSADNTFDRAFTNNLATAIEGHPDNASASVFGGMTLSWADDVDSGQIHSVQLEV